MCGLCNRIQHNVLVTSCEIAPVARSVQSVETDAHNLQTMQAHHRESKSLAHPSDLTVATFSKHDTERL